LNRTVKQTLRGSALLAPVRRWRLEKLISSPGYVPDWATLLSGHQDLWRKALSSANGPRIAIASSLGLNSTVNTVDSLIAVALTLRGARVDLVFCDSALPACQVIEHTLVPSVGRTARLGPAADFCTACSHAAARTYAPTGLTLRRFSDYLTFEDRQSAAAFAASTRCEEAGDRSLCDHALAGALRFFGRAELGADPYTAEIHTRYREAAWLASRAIRRLLQKEPYDAVVAHHGIYVPQGQIAAETRAAGTRLVTWHTAYRKGRLIYQHNDTYHREMIIEPVSSWGGQPLSADEDAALTDYLTSRETGSQDWITFQRKAPGDKAAVYAELDLDPAKPVYLLAANVAWDARLHYPGSAYGHMIEWAEDTVRWFAQRPDLQLVVRCHPGEVISSPRAQDRLDHHLAAAFPDMPPNVRIITPEMETNTYAIARTARGTLIYNTKMGVELAARGNAVVVAGDAWIRGKGFSRDASDAASYLALLEDETTFRPLTDGERDLARRYAFHFFFRRCLQVGALDSKAGWPLTPLTQDAFQRAMPGADDGLDTICKGILEGAPFEAPRPLAKRREETLRR
jgi:hypothetical protein